MSLVELLTVQDCFPIEGRGLVVIPDFRVPAGWKDRSETVAVTRPDGVVYETEARFSTFHFRLLDRTASLDRSWRIVVQLLDRQKDDLPVGSKISVSPETRDAIILLKQA